MANHVLQLDASVGGAGLIADLGSETADVWVTLDVACNASFLAWLTGQAFSYPVAFVYNGAEDTGLDTNLNPTGWGWDVIGGSEFGNFPVTLTALQAYQIEMHVTAGSPFTAAIFVDGASFGTITPSENTTGWQHYELNVGGIAPGGSYVYVDNYKVGTTRGGSDLFSDDFEGSLPGGWNEYYAPTVASIVDDPGIIPPGPPPPPVGAGGINIAFNDNALEPSPTYTRIDNRKGVNVATVRIRRGRPDERSKCQIGTATANGYDTVGDLDPTNASGPFYGKLDPVKPGQIMLYNPIAATWSPIFTGYSEDWTYDLDVSEKKLDFQLELVDMLDMFNDAEIIPDQAGNTVPGESVGDVFYTGQHVDDRLRAVLADASTAFLAATWPAALLNIFTGNVNVQGRIYSARTSLLQVIDEACDAEFPGVSNRFIGKDGVFDFRGRLSRYNPSAYIAGSGNAGTARMAGSKPGLHWYVGDQAAAKLDNTLVVYTGLKFTRGKTNLINASLVTPLGIAQKDIPGQFVFDSTSVGKYGPRTSGMSLENIITGDGNDDGLDALPETKAMGQGTVDNYKDPVTRVSQLVFRNPPAGASLTRQTVTWLLLCGIELSDLITVTSHHPGGGGFAAVDFFVEGITYDLKPLRGDTWDVTLTLDVSPAAYYATNPFPHS